jgi:hypothetical protein
VGRNITEDIKEVKEICLASLQKFIQDAIIGA